jgi:glycine/D-amino acid oxidase-like deaminating enzyme
MLDFILVGQGLAGSVLAYTLVKQGHKILVLDNAKQLCSKAALGICNPITGRFLKKTWIAETIFPFFRDFYLQMELDLNTHFFYPQEIYRPFQSVDEQNAILSLGTDSKMYDYINTEISMAYPSLIHSPIGGWQTRQGAYVDVNTLMQSVKLRLSDINSYQEDELDYNDLLLESDSVQWKSFRAKKIIFCEGIAALNNPYFQWLPFSPVKGEWLGIEVPALEKEVDDILHLKQELILLSTGKNHFRAGATYEWDNLSIIATEKAKNEITEKLRKNLLLDFEVREQVVGIRPASKTRTPFLGLHPQYPQIAIFNGLGTKGVSLAPYFADQLIGFLTQKTPLMAEVNIERYYKKYFVFNLI